MTGEHSASRSVETLREEAPHLIAAPADDALEWLRRADEELADVARVLFSRTGARRRGEREELGRHVNGARSKIVSARLLIEGAS